MVNGRFEEAERYHRATKHSYQSVRASGHTLDWQNRPSVYKVYPDLAPIPLRRGFAWPQADTLQAVSSPGCMDEKTPGIEEISRLLFFSGGETKKKVYPGGEEYQFRAAACAGALYPIEIYLVCADIDGLEAGVYHFHPGEFALRRLRRGDHRPELTGAAGDNQAIAAAPVTIVLSAIFWRSAWKYQARCYRYCFWDGGTVAANFLAVAASEGVSCSVEIGFVDSKVNRLMGLDGRREAALCLLPLGRCLGWAEHAGDREAQPLAYRAAALSEEEVDYPLLEEMHAASSLVQDEEVRPWRGVCQRSDRGDGKTPVPLEWSQAGSGQLGKVIAKRGSTRRFAREQIRFDELSAMLYFSTRGIPSDFLEGPETSLLDLYLIANAVEGLEPGSYYFSPVGCGLERLQAGPLRDRAGYLCLEQSLAADASAVLFFLSDLGRVLARFGNRGYRAAQFEAGIVGGKLYLSAYALGLGASGLTFYDDDAVDFFSPHAKGKDAIFVVALGKSKRA